ncbi:hypothetical protein [Klebsiella variicola]|uniref:hypothetical protein n=1 Tax=Klebsiella variicola TaxID=244366 RepID=UPI00388E5351
MNPIKNSKPDHRLAEQYGRFKIPLDLSSQGIALKFYLSRRTAEGESLLRIEEIKGHEEVEAVKRLKKQPRADATRSRSPPVDCQGKQTAKLAIF